ncbi:hypothetical protein F4604DRAFT_1942588 [Suillus subluteus]|nr:hypothetical protein F4604DRAFT_1942588 [Suillus subluteus]
MKRCIALLEEQNTELRMPTASEKTTKNHALEGQFDRHVALGASNISEADAPEILKPHREQTWLPNIQETPNMVPFSAKSHDTTSLKFIVAVWLMQMVLTPNPSIQCRDKYGHGFYHDVTGDYYALLITTGMMLCEYRWYQGRNLLIIYSVQEAIRSYHPDYRVTSYSWPSFLYKDGQYDATKSYKGFLKGELLVKAASNIYLHLLVQQKKTQETLQPDASTETPSQVHLPKR